MSMLTVFAICALQLLPQCLSLINYSNEQLGVLLLLPTMLNANRILTILTFILGCWEHIEKAL
jgi:hypothetical protein